MSKHKRNILIWGVLTILWTGVIFSFSLQPASQSASLSQGLLQTVLDWFYRITAIRIPVESMHGLFRKTAHFCEFFLLGIFGGNFFRLAYKNLSLTLIYGGIVAVADECLQYLTGAGRAMRFGDMLLDFCGVLCAVIFLWRCRNRSENRNQFSEKR